MSTGSNEMASVANMYESKKANKAAQEQQNYWNVLNMMEQKRQYNQNRADLRPYTEAGYKSLAEINALMGQSELPNARTAALSRFHTDPGYEFAIKQGVGALDRSAIKQGGLYSGRQMMALNDYGQGMADQQYGNYYNRLWNTANMGRGTAVGVADMGTNYANSMGNLYNRGSDIASRRIYGDAQAMGQMASTIGANQQEGFNTALNTVSSLYGGGMLKK